ncbi:MAG TPA: hypothetical protein VJB99_04805, partial [Patescibacteria group bacterium]|nr:hypothetical protein [Patescibacteria group bacterium]
DVRLLFPRLGASRIVSLTGEESASRRLDAWHAIQKGAARVLVGTRAASLLLPTETDMVFLLNSSDRNHRQETRNPRYDARENAWKLHEHTGCRLAFFDVVPRVEEIVRFGKDRLIFQLIFPPPIRWADLHQEGAASPHPLVSSTAAEAIQNALTEGRRTVFLYDRKGTGRALRCADCRRGFPCPSCGCPFASDEATVVCRHCGRVEPAPTSCPDCGGMRLQEMGYGTRSLQNVFRRLFPNASVSLVQQGRVEDLSADILVTTSFFFESILDPFRREPPIGLFILGDADLPLTRPNYRSLEEAVRDVATLSGMAASFRVPCVIQSRAPKLFQNALERLSEFFSSELALRKQYGLPPSVRRLCVTSRADDPRRARFELDQLAEALTTLEGVRLLPNPPDRHQKLSLGISADLTAVSAVLTRLKQLPDHLVIDANTDL